MSYTYILYSTSLDRYYVGSTRGELSERIRRHNTHHKGFTGSINDWKLIYSESFEDYKQAHVREIAIKRWKSRTKIEELIKN